MLNIADQLINQLHLILRHMVPERQQLRLLGWLRYSEHFQYFVLGWDFFGGFDCYSDGGSLGGVFETS